jgi:4-hydroxy-3-polyprenylbenzoate decarboxylase
VVGGSRLLRVSATEGAQPFGEIVKPVDVLDHDTSEIASGSKLGIDATKKLPGEGFKRPWPPLIKMDAAVKAKVEILFNP